MKAKEGVHQHGFPERLESSSKLGPPGDLERDPSKWSPEVTKISSRENDKKAVSQTSENNKPLLKEN